MTDTLKNYHFASSADAPLVSVIMPVRNCRAFVNEAVESILCQTFDDFEFIIVDDASDDATFEALKDIADERVIVIRQGEATGPYPARNKALWVARGEFVALMDADDVSHPERLAREVEYLSAHPEIALVGTCYRLIDENGAEKSRWEVLLDSDEIKRELPKKNWFCGPSVMFRRACLADVGLFDERFRYAADYDMWLRITEKYGVANIGEFLYDYREHDGQITTSRRSEQNRFASMIKRRTAPPESAGARPLATVVIATRNRPALVREAVESVLCQTAENIEIIVVNDAGQEVDSEVPRRAGVTYVSSRRCRGLAATRNIGAKLARGGHICFLDDDDALFPRHFEVLIGAMNHAGASVAYSNSIEAHIMPARHTDGYKTLERRARMHYPFSQKQLLVMNFIPVHNVVFRAECLEETGLFDESLPVLEDWDLWIRLSEHYEFLPVFEETAEVRLWKDGSNMTTAKRALFIGAMRKIYSRYAHLVNGDAETIRRQRHCLRNVLAEVRAMREKTREFETLSV